MSSSQGADAAEGAVAAILATPPLDELEGSIMHATAPRRDSASGSSLPYLATLLAFPITSWPNSAARGER
jgi:hypothetical protein